MERKDKRITVHEEWEANYNATGRSTRDESTTELSGSRREADLILAGLHTLRAQLEMAQAVLPLVTQSSRESNYRARSKSDEVAKLIESIEQPNYIADPEVRYEYS